MKTLLTLLLLAPASACFAQADYTAVIDTPAKLENEQVPAYRTLADTASKPFTKLFARSNVIITGRLSTRWAIVSKANTDYVVRMQQLPMAVQQAVTAAKALHTYSRDPVTDKFIYSDVVQAPGISQGDLYTRAKLWYANTFRTLKDAAQVDEKDAGLLQGTGFRDIYILPQSALEVYKAKLWYTVKLSVREGRFKYEITDFRLEDYPSKQRPVPGQPVPIETYFNPKLFTGFMVEGVGRSTRHQFALAGDEIVTSITQAMGRPGGKDW